jgi:hypothetical protein
MLWEAGAFVYLHWTTAQLLHLTGTSARLMALGLAVVWAIGAWRISKIGLYVGQQGLMIRNLLTTRMIRWDAVDNIIVENVIHRIISFSIPSGRCAFVLLDNGSRVKTSLWENGVDFHSCPEDFYATCQTLRQRLAAVRAEGATP